eukprot:5204843-Amphidinium_carterae.2
MQCSETRREELEEQETNRQMKMRFYHDYLRYQTTTSHFQMTRERSSMTTKTRSTITAEYLSTRSARRLKACVACTTMQPNQLERI